MESTAGGAGSNLGHIAGDNPMAIEAQQQQLQQGAFAPPRLTFDELAVLRECARESFFYRCVPLAAGSCLALKYLQSRGVIKAHPVYGLWLKYAAAIGVGYFVGKLSYIQQCQQKILTRLPSSNLAQALLRRGGGQFPRVSPFMMQGSNHISPVDDAVSGATPQQSTDDYAFYNPDFSISKSVDSVQDGQEKRAAKSRTNYDDLRMANRRDFLQNYTQGGQPVKSGALQPAGHMERDQQDVPLIRGQKVEEQLSEQQKPHRGRYGDEGFN